MADLAQGDSGRSKKAKTHYGSSLTPGKAGTCYKCGEEGHKQASCPQNSSRNDRETPKKKARQTPKVKKFWCALHKEQPGRRCSSESCNDLRHTEVQRRIALLKENGDCFHCCGDHKPGECRRAERVCGGGKEDRGCTRSHKVHELFCVDAKVFTVQQAIANTVRSKSEGVVLGN